MSESQQQHASLYVLSRLAAAALNLLSVVVFTRLAPPTVYGDYLVGFAVSVIVFGAGFQWFLHAQFGTYRHDTAARLAGALAFCLLGTGLVTLLALASAALLGWLSILDALGIAGLVGGMVIHVGLVELGRTRLLVREVTLAGLLRGVLMLFGGSIALTLAPSAWLLLLTIGVSQALCALLIVPALLRHGVAWPQRADIKALAKFGWPLIPALAGGAIAINLDRLVLAQQAGPAITGSYGATSDLIRQGFVVMGEAIAAAYMSQAKSLPTGTAAQSATLQRAFVTLWCIVLLGVLTWLLLGSVVTGFVLGPGYGLDDHGPLLPLLVMGTAILALRAYYFGQVIYFSGSVRREVGANIVMLTLALSSLLLVPLFGATGAAASFMLSQAGRLAAFVWADRNTQFMPMPARLAGSLALQIATAALCGFVALWLHWSVAALVIALTSMVMAWRYDLFGARCLLAQREISRQ